MFLAAAVPSYAATVAISPTSTSVPTSGERQFGATVSGIADTTVSWTVNDIPGGNSTFGTIDATGKYVAPATPPSGYAVTVKAVSNGDPTATASAAVQVRWPVPWPTAIVPSSIPLGAFSITVNGSRFVSGATVNWNGTPLATAYKSSTQLTATGTATTAGNISVTVVNPGPGSVSTPLTVTVTTNISVAVAPLTAVLQPGGSASFAATVSNTQNTAVTWMVNNVAGGDPTNGTITQNGVYTAPQIVPTAGYVTVAAVSQADNTTKGTAAVTIQDPQAIHVGRFLEQSTFGPTPVLMAHVRQVGTDAFIDEQLALPESPLPPLTATRGEVIDAFFNNQRNGNDQLRQRVIYALSEIVVVSMQKNTNGNEIVPWLQILSRNAFGNYRTLLGEITLDASMGKYLDMVNSSKASGSGGANENYAREVMQLFTIGLVELDANGQATIIDPQTNLPKATYTQTDVAELARAFTGWTYDNGTGQPAQYPRGAYYPGKMVPMANYHDTGDKYLFNKTKHIAAGLSPQGDVDAALDILFQHPNVGPFLATRLIRALVTSNPSPQYIGRVAAVFNDDGTPQHVRGNMAAVVRAILTDVEARNDNPPSYFGRLRTPVQQTIAMSRALGLPMSGASSINYLFASMGEDELGAPSVFGHYSPTFRIPKSGGYFGPEFQIYTAAEAINRGNFLYQMFFGSGGTPHPMLQPFVNLAADPVALTNAVDNALLYGRMTDATRQAILQSHPAMIDNNQRALNALYLTVMSGEYLVQH